MNQISLPQPIQVEVLGNWWMDTLLPPIITGVLVWAITYGVVAFTQKKKEEAGDRIRLRSVYMKTSSLLNNYGVLRKIIVDLIKYYENNPNVGGTFKELFHVASLNLDYFDDDDVLFVESLARKKDERIAFQQICDVYKGYRSRFLDSHKRLTELSAEFNSVGYQEMKNLIESSGQEHNRSVEINKGYLFFLNTCKDHAESLIDILFQVSLGIQKLASSRFKMELPSIVLHACDIEEVRASVKKRREENNNLNSEDKNPTEELD